jgi:hypothetical protein
MHRSFDADGHTKGEQCSSALWLFVGRREIGKTYFGSEVEDANAAGVDHGATKRSGLSIVEFG